MTNLWMAGLFGISLGLVSLSPAFSTPISASYNCFSREVWSAEKQAWCNQNSPILNPTEMSMEPPLIAAEETLANQLHNTEWILEDLNGTGVIDNLQTTIMFEAGGDRINGNGGCNRYFSNIDFDEEGATATSQAVSLGMVGSTMMACPEALMDQEGRYFQALQTAQRIELDGPYLYIYSEGQEQPMRFTQLNSAERVDPPMSTPDPVPAPTPTPEPMPTPTTEPIPGLW
jgi:heat shock protein HslJ